MFYGNICLFPINEVESLQMIPLHECVQVELDNDILVDLGGWAAVKEAQQLVKDGCVQNFSWADKKISGKVHSGDQEFRPSLNLRSITFAESRCSCIKGRRGAVCAHALALCLASINAVNSGKAAVSKEAEQEESSANPGETEKPGKLQSLVLSESKGIPCRFVVLLPPNLEHGVKKDRIAVRVELEQANGGRFLLEKLDRGRAYWFQEWDQHLGGKIEKLCGGKLHSNLQLSRVQLEDVLKILEGRGFVAWLRNPRTAIEWKEDGTLLGIHEILSSFEKPVEESHKRTARTGNSRRHSSEKSRSITVDNRNRMRVQVDGSPHYLAITLPSREDPSHHEILDLLRSWRFKLEPSNGKWWLRDNHHVLNFLADHLDTFREQYQAEFSDNFKKRLSHIQQVDVNVDIREVEKGFEIKLGLTGRLSPESLNQQLARGRRFIESDGKTYLISGGKLASIEQLTKKLSAPGQSAMSTRVGVPIRASFEDLCDWEETLETGGVNWSPPETWKARSQAIRNLSKLREAPVESSLNQKLRLYQKIGVAWMYHLYRNQLAGILADEMGLGKTVQAIALITAIHSADRKELSLIVCPAGLVGNWKREFSEFAGDLRVYSHHGAERSAVASDWAGKYDVVITSYSTLARDIELFTSLEWKLVIGDEAQHIKNRRTQHAKSLKRLNTSGRFLLTGTPIENSVEDLLSLFEFLLPGYLEKAPAEVTKLEDRQWQLQRIRERAAHYLLRRTKVQVAPELPEKLEQVIYCDMDTAQSEIYERYRRRSSLAIEKMEGNGASEGAIRMAVFTELLRLRQICADPRILESELDASVSCKLGVFRELLQESIDGGHRMLVFSQFVSVLQLLKTELETNGISYAYIDGQTRDRLKEANRFNRDENLPVFLISLKAGGTGLNLTGADTVVHFDPWWNPAAEAQATDRAHRIGQTRAVTSIRLIVAGSVEEKVQLMQQQKRKLLDELFDESAATSGKFELSEMKSLLE